MADSVELLMSSNKLLVKTNKKIFKTEQSFFFFSPAMEGVVLTGKVILGFHS